MTWSFVRARQAAADVRTAPLGWRAVRAVRPRSVLGLVRSRAPLSLLLYVAARDGLVVEQDGGGFAVLQRPGVDRPIRSGGAGLRLLRGLDRHWDLVVFAGPPPACLAFAAGAVVWPAIRPAAIVAALAAMLWITVFLLGMLVAQVRHLAGLGAPGHGRTAGSLSGHHWSVPLTHQPDADRVPDLLLLLTGRLRGHLHDHLKASAAGRARVPPPEVTETLVVLTGGITTPLTRTAMTTSVLALHDRSSDDEVIVLAAPGRVDEVPVRATAGGAFLLWYVAGVAAVVAAGAAMVAAVEGAECRPACAGRPADYPTALRWLLQRLLFTDPPGIAPGTARVAVFGWLVSLAAVMFVVVAVVAARQEIDRNRRVHTAYDDRVAELAATARVLILVVTAVERDAVLAAVRDRVGRDPVQDRDGERTIHRLGRVAGAELLLVQAAEQGTASAAGMMMTARSAIDRIRPDHVILTGICYGLRPDEGQRLGDIVVARRVHNIDPRRVTGRNQRTIYRGVNVGPSAVLLDRFQAGQATWAGATVHFGTVLTSGTLVDSAPLVDHLRSEFPDAIAGEMEGTGVHESASSSTRRPDWIMVKAIADWGRHKTARAQPRAARNAAEFVTHVIAGGGLPRRPR